MAPPESFRINVGEHFAHLARAPIVEAVVDIRCRPAHALEESALRSALQARLEGYEFLDSQREFEGEMKLQAGGPVSQTVRDLGWKGLRFKSTDGKHIAQFNRSGFVFSRLEPYQNWGQLTEEAFRLWEVFRQFAQPVEVQRIGLRFINRIRMPEGNHQVGEYIQPAPTHPRELPLPFSGFMHQDILSVPGRPYAMKIARTIQPPREQETQIAMILDIDVFTTQPFALDSSRLIRYLEEMRWLKNKAFFGSVTEATLNLCR